MNNEEFEKLDVGDIVRGKYSLQGYTVVANYGYRKTAIRVKELTHADEWDLIRKVHRGDPNAELRMINHELTKIVMDAGFICGEHRIDTVVAYVNRLCAEVERLQAPPVGVLRASGDCICHVCKVAYRHHPFAEEHIDQSGDPFLNRLCDGTLVKL